MKTKASGKTEAQVFTEAIDEVIEAVRERVYQAIIVARELGELDNKNDARSVALREALEYDSSVSADYIVDKIKELRYVPSALRNGRKAA